MEFVVGRCRSAAVPLYGVAGWSGAVEMAGYHGPPVRVYRLRHTDGRDGFVEVETATGERPTRLVFDLSELDLPADVVPVPVEIAVDGVPTRFDVVAHGGAFAAHGGVGDVVVTVFGRGCVFAELSLSRVTDLGAYEAGFRAAATQW